MAGRYLVFLVINAEYSFEHGAWEVTWNGLKCVSGDTPWCNLYIPGTAATRPEGTSKSICALRRITKAFFIAPNNALVAWLPVQSERGFLRE